MDKFEKIKGYYAIGLWDKAQVHKAVGRWIIAEQYKEITGGNYK